MADTKKIINSYLTFTLENEIFAVNVSQVANILELVKITKIPKAPVYMKGVINLRGSVLPVVDVRVKFDFPSIEFTKNTVILVLEVLVGKENITLGALVDSVSEVIEIQDDEVLSPPRIGTTYQSEFIIGMIKLDDEFIMILNINKVFSSDEIIKLSETMEYKNAIEAEQSEESENN